MTSPYPPDPNQQPTQYGPPQEPAAAYDWPPRESAAFPVPYPPPQLGVHPPPQPTVYPTQPAPPGHFGYPPPTVPPRRPLSTGMHLLIVGGVFAAVCLVGGVAAAILSPDSTTTTTTGSVDTRPPAPTTRPPTATPVVKATGIGSAVAAWWTGGASARAGALGQDFQELQTAASTADVAGSRRACVKVQTDVEAAQAYQQMPDPQAQASWAAALASYARAATDCIAGVDAVNADLISRAGNEMSDGAANLTKVAARVKELAGR